MIQFNLLCEYTRFNRVETQQETTTWKHRTIPFSGGRGNWIAVFLKGYQLMGINLAMTIFQVHNQDPGKHCILERSQQKTILSSYYGPFSGDICY